jgi:hypothetical protein
METNMNDVWIRYTYSWDGIEFIIGVYATPELAMGEYGHIGWKKIENGNYILEDVSNGMAGDIIVKYTIIRDSA